MGFADARDFKWQNPVTFAGQATVKVTLGVIFFKNIFPSVRKYVIFNYMNFGQISPQHEGSSAVSGTKVHRIMLVSFLLRGNRDFLLQHRIRMFSEYHFLGNCEM